MHSLLEFGDLYRAYSRWLHRSLSQLGHAREAGDLVQETYFRIAQADLGEVRHPKAFLLRVAMNAARDQMRRSAVRGGAMAVPLEEVWETEALGAPSDQDETVLLKQIILSMPELYRDVFLLSRFGGLSYEEIAVRCGISVKTVEWRMSKALAHCTAQLRA